MLCTSGVVARTLSKALFKANGSIGYSFPRSTVRPSMMVFTVRMAHISPHMVQVPSVEGGALSK